MENYQTSKYPLNLYYPRIIVDVCHSTYWSG